MYNRIGRITVFAICTLLGNLLYQYWFKDTPDYVDAIRSTWIGVTSVCIYLWIYGND